MKLMILLLVILRAGFMQELYFETQLQTRDSQPPIYLMRFDYQIMLTTDSAHGILFL